MQTRKLTLKQQKFVDCYDGNIKEAANKAGLSYRYCRGLMAKKHILEAIKNRQNTEVRPKTIADRQKRQRFWTKVMNDKSEKMSDRLKASELLGKSEADFTENVAHSGNITNPMANMTPKQRLELFVKQAKET
jgi:phage terminase small subunit